MNDVLEQIIRTGYVEKPDRSERIELNSSVSPDKGKFLQDIVCELKAETTLETGCCFGVSGLWICDGLKHVNGRRHHVIDPYQDEWYHGIGRHHFQQAGYGDLVELHLQPSHLALPLLESRGETLDFAFVDGWHTFDYALVDFFHIDRMLRTGGVIVLDDTNYASIRKLCRYITTNLNYAVHACCVERTERWFTRTERLLYHAGHRYQRVRQHLRAETATPDIDLGILAGSTAVAFRKTADDNRSFDFHRDF